MRLYEMVYIFDASLDEDAVNGRLERFHQLLTEPGGEIVAVDHWGVRQLAYPVNKAQSGYYVVAQFHGEAPSLPEFERIVRLDETVLRYLLVLNEGEATTGMSLVAEVRVGEEPAGGREEEDDDEGEEAAEEEETDSDSPPEFQGGRGRRRRHEGPAILQLNYKDVSTLSRFLTEQGKILPKRTTKVTARFQRQLGRAVKRARYLALIPYIQEYEA
jgi:small subunit ribosomal protein S6